MVLAKHSERGSAIILLFVSVALFGAVGWVMLQSSRTSADMVRGVQADAGDIAGQDCTNTLDMAFKRLDLGGCTVEEISYEADGSAALGPADGRCALFSPNGGGAKPCGLVGCPLDQLPQIGSRCNGVVFAGITPDGNHRMYTTAADGVGLPWNNGNNVGWTNVTGQSGASGTTNTARMMATDANSITAGFQPHLAAKYCADLVYNARDDWYLPARLELDVLYDHKDEIGNFAATNYWASSQSSATQAYIRHFGTGVSSSTAAKNNPRVVRCVLKD